MVSFQFVGVFALITSTGAFAFGKAHLGYRDSEDGVENARTACSLLNETLPELVAFPGEQILEFISGILMKSFLCL